MEKRNVKISFCKSGNGIGAKLTLPMPFMRALGISKEEREIELILDEENQVITIKKR
jgi:hypothetical protein